MSKPFMAKGIDTRLKRGSTPGFIRCNLVLCEGAADGIASQDNCREQAVTRHASEMARLPLDEGDPLPPGHDRATCSPDLLASLYREERPLLLRFLSRWTGHDKAEDVIQRVFSRMAGSLDHDGRAIRAPGAYLRQAARNVLRDEARVGLVLGLDMGQWWESDDAFLALLRDRELLGALLADVAGEAVAAANAKEKAKTQRRILGDHLRGENGRQARAGWVPRWMAFPPSAYTARGGVGSVNAHGSACAAASAAEDREDDPVPPQGGAALPDPDGEEGDAQRHRAEQEQDRLAA